MDVNARLRIQHGIISRAQARAAGMTDHQIDRKLRHGEWIRVHQGVFRSAAHRLTWIGRAMAATIAADAPAGGRCATALWGLDLLREPPIEVVVDHRRPLRLPGVVVRRSLQLDSLDTTIRRGVPCTGIERTLLDAAADVSDAMIERLCEAAIRQRLTSWEALSAIVDQLGGRGRNGTARLRQLTDRRMGDPTVPLSDFSRRVAHLLEAHGVEAPTLEYLIRDHAGIPLLLADLAWPQRLCAVELDGMADHFGRTARLRDMHKRALVRAAGWRLVEISWDLLEQQPDEVVSIVRNFLAGGGTVGRAV